MDRVDNGESVLDGRNPTSVLFLTWTYLLKDLGSNPAWVMVLFVPCCFDKLIGLSLIRGLARSAGPSLVS